MAAGVSILSGREIGWVVVITSNQELLKLTTSNRSNAKNRLWNCIHSERAFNVSDILTTVKADAGSSSKKLCSKLPLDLQPIGKNIGMPSSKSSADDSEATKHLFTWYTSQDVASQRDLPAISSKHFECHDQLMATFFGPIRLYYGSGWFGNARNFFDGLTSHMKTASSGGMFTDETVSVSGSRLLANIGTGRLTEFGWLPSNWNLLRSLMDSEGNVDKYPIRRLRLLDEQGIRIFKLPSLRLVHEICMDLDNAHSLQAREQLFFGSSFSADRALLVIEYKNYGKRVENNMETVKSWDYGKMFLYRFSIGIVSILRGFFSKAENIVIAYSDTASMTTKSAVLHRLISLYRLTPNDRDLEESIKRETRSIIYSSLPRPVLRTAEGRLPGRDAYFDACLELDRQIYTAAGKDRSSQWTPIVPRDPSPQNPIMAVIDQAESNADSIEDSHITGLRGGSELLPLCQDDKRLLIGSAFGEKTDRTAHSVYVRMRDSVRANGASFEKLNLASASRYRPITLFYNIAKFLRRVVQRTLFVPIGLQEWVEKRFRLVWFIPLDSMNSLGRCIQGSRANRVESQIDLVRIRPGNKLSTLVYPWLFATDAGNDTIEVDLTRLFDFIEDLRIDRFRTGNASWLTNRFVETQYLLAGLDEKFGYCSDFDISGLFMDGTRQERSARCVELLSTQTILKCILMHEDGCNALDEWRDDLLNRCNSFLASIRKQNQSHDSIDLPPVEVFIDTMGLAAAAIDVCRGGLARKVGNECTSLKVHMIPGRLVKHFGPQHDNASPNAVNFDDGIFHERVDGLDESEISNMEIRLANIFANTPFDIQSAVDLLNVWYMEEGILRGETVEDLLSEIDDALVDVAGAYAGYKANVDALLKAFHEQSGS